MSQQELPGYVVRILDHLGIPYLLSGSLASSLQGEPRATHDIDLVVELTQEEGERLGEAFPSSRFYGDKIDFRLLTRTPFDEARFARRRREAASPWGTSAKSDTL